MRILLFLFLQVSDGSETASMRDYLAKNIPGISIFSANELSESKKDFLASNNAMVIMANRFDGVDFPNEESRMLIVYNLPKVTHLQERFLVSKMAAAVLYAERIKTRIVQAAGRCTRNASDYSVVCVLGDSILNEMTSPAGLASYHPEMRAEIQFGIENSTDFSNVEDIMENVQIFFNRNDEWESAEAEIVERRDEFVLCGDNTEQEKLYVKLCNAAQLEVKVQYALWKKDYQTALENILTIISLLDAPSLSGYKCYWQCSGSSIDYGTPKPHSGSPIRIGYNFQPNRVSFLRKAQTNLCFYPHYVSTQPAVPAGTAQSTKSSPVPCRPARLPLFHRNHAPCDTGSENM